MKASTAVITQTVVWIRPTGTPRVAARSERSATARIAIPILVYRMNSARAPSTRGTMMNTMRSLSLKKTPPTSTLTSKGGFSCGRPTFLNPNQLGMNSARAVSSCAMPIVATVRTRRGERQNRLMKVRSTMKPRRMARAQAHRDRHGVRDAGHPVGRAAGSVLGDQEDREDGGNGAEVALGEVDDPIGSVDERQPHREHGGERADQRALHDDATGRAPHDLAEDDQHDGGDGPGHPSPLGPGAAVEQQQAHDGHQAEDLLGPVRGLAEEDDERRRGADEKCPPGYSGPRLRRREPAQRALTVVAPRPCSPSTPTRPRPTCGGNLGAPRVRCWSLDLP